MRHRILRHISQRTEMLAAVSHDLRTPLTRMQLELELLGQGDDPVLAGLRQDVGEMSKLVEEYLGFARGEGREVVEPTDLEPILESMRQRARPQRRRPRHFDGPAGGAAAAADRVSPLPGQPGRQCLPLCQMDRHLGQAEDEMVEIAVDDDGPGIPEAFREKVFEPFVRLEGQPEGDNGGTGLGLTIARDVVLSTAATCASTARGAAA